MRHIAFAFAFIVCTLLLAQAGRGGTTPPAIQPCNAQISAACNPSPNNYYSQSTATPVAIASVSYTNSPYPAPNVQGRFSEIVDPQSDAILHVTAANVNLSNVQHIVLGEYNMRTNTVYTQATIESFNCSHGNTPHDWAGLIPGPNGEMAIPFGGISAAGKAQGSSSCTVSTNMCGNAACTTAGSTTAEGEPMKFASPLASPATVAASTQYFANIPDNPSELWSVCFSLIPGDTDTWSNEARRCLWGGQTHNQTNALNGNSSTNWIMQVAGTMHWGSAVMTPYEDTVTSVAASGSCPTSGVGPTGGAVASDSFCYDPINTAISAATSGSLHLNGDASDGIWQGWEFSSITTTANTVVTFTTPTIPGTSAPGHGTTCSISAKMAASGTETAVQAATDLANAFNGNTTNGATTGNTLTTNCASLQSSYVMYASPNGGAGVNAFTGSCCGYQLTCTSANPCLILALQPTATYSTSADVNSTVFSTNWSTITAGCTNCAAAGVNGLLGGGQNQHNTVGNCRLLEWGGEEGVCLFGVDHIVRGPLFAATSCVSSCTPGMDAVTGYAQALELMCFNKNSYTVANPPTWTFRTCDINSGGAPGASYTIAPNNALNDSNPANELSPSVAQGGGASATCSISPWLVCAPATTSGTVSFIPFTFDWSANADPCVINNCNFPAINAWDVTNIIGGAWNGDLFIALSQGNAALAGSKEPWGCIIETHTQPISTPRCDQIDNGTFTGQGDNMTMSLATGASGTMYLFVSTGSGTIHGCTSTCIIEYKATPPSGAAAISWTFVKTINVGACTATAAAGGLTAADEEGGYHMLSTQACLTGGAGLQTATTFVYDSIIP